jgi:hypothetical protein
MPTLTPERAIPDDSHLCARCKMVPHGMAFRDALCLECWFEVCTYDFSEIIREMRDAGKGG